MPGGDQVPSMEPPSPSVNASLTTSGTLTTTTLVPWDQAHLQGHTILIVVIFSVVCFLLLFAFFYAFCFHCSIGLIAKDSRAANGSSPDREEATYRCSSTDNQPVENIV